MRHCPAARHPRRQGPRRCRGTTGRAQGCRRGLPGPMPSVLRPCSAGVGKAACQAAVSVRCLPEGHGRCLSPPRTASPHTGRAPWALPGSRSARPEGQRAPHSTAPRPGVGQATGKDLGAESWCYGECPLRGAGSPVSGRQAGPACGPAAPVVPEGGGCGVRGPGGHAPAAGAEGVRRQDGCLAYESPAPGPGRAEGRGQAPKACPAARTLCKGPVPSHAPWVPLPLSPASRRYLGPRRAGAAEYGQRQGCGQPGAMSPCPCLVPACAQLRRQGSSGSTDGNAEEARQGLVSRSHPGQPRHWPSSPCLASSERGTQPAGAWGSPWLSLGAGTVKPDVPLGPAAGSALGKTQLCRELLCREKKSFSRKFPPRTAVRFPAVTGLETEASVWGGRCLRTQGHRQPGGRDAVFPVRAGCSPGAVWVCRFKFSGC